jgi:hypothetical protein
MPTGDSFTHVPSVRPHPGLPHPGARPAGVRLAAAKQLLKAQPRLFTVLGVGPPVLAGVWWLMTGSAEGFKLAGVILAGVVLYVGAHALLKTMTGEHWGIVAGAVVGALMLNGGMFGWPMLISFGSLLALGVLLLRQPPKQIPKILLIAALVWLGTAGASTMNAAHDQVQAGLADAAPHALIWAREQLAGLFGGGLG